MDIATAMKIRLLINEVSRLIDQATDAPPVVVGPGDTSPPNAPVDPEIINGHSRLADNDGFVTIPAVDAFIETLPRNLRPLVPRRFALESAYRNSIFPTPEAKAKCYTNLCWRYRVIFMPGQGAAAYQHEAILFRLVAIPGAKVDFNTPPEVQASTQFVWHRDKILVAENGEGAYSSDWNPKKDAAFMLEVCKARIAAAQAPKDPTDAR